MADYFDQQIDQGRQPEEFARIWLHTHPGTSPQPSPTDVETFTRVFGRCDWAVMFILARGGRTSARLQVPRINLQVQLRTRVDYSQPFAGTEYGEWKAEYQQLVQCPLKLPPAENLDARALLEL